MKIARHKKKIATELTITIIKSSTFLAPRKTFKRRSTTAKSRLVSCSVNGFSAKSKVKQFVDTTKLMTLINDFHIDNAEDFISAIGKCFPQQVEKELKSSNTKYNSKYQLLDFSVFGVKILFRISNHNINCNNITDDISEAYSVALKSRKSKNTFKPNDLDVTEYVFFIENCDQHRFLLIAEELLVFLETSEWNNDFVPADAINHSPQLKGLQGTPDEKGKGTIAFAQTLAEHYENGESYDWRKAQEMGEAFKIKSKQELMQACELAVVLAARKIAHNGQSLAQRFAALKDLYEQQVTIQPLDSRSKILQQYSTPCPLAFLLGEYVNQGDDLYYLEPSAGNGMLTIALPENCTTVNDLDEIRFKNLQSQGFEYCVNQDATKPIKIREYRYNNGEREYYGEPYTRSYNGVITNPPFAQLKTPYERNGWTFTTLDHQLAIMALDAMFDYGRAAIIVGGKMWDAYWKPLSERSEKQVLFGKWKIFLGYLYAQYNVEDVIYINGYNIYRKQGTTYPIVAILINGRHKYDESIKPNYVFNPSRDTIIDTFDQFFDRMMPHLTDTNDTKPTDERDTMRFILKQLVKELGEEKGRETFEWYCKTYNVDIADAIPSVVRWEVFGSDKTFTETSQNKKDQRLRLAKAKAKALMLYTYSGLNGTDIYAKYQTFIKDALASKNRNIIECTDIISEHSKKIVNYLLGKRIIKYYIKSTDIRHAKNKHSKKVEYKYKQIPLTDADLLKIPEILSEPTNIDLPLSNAKNGQGIRFIKEYPDGKIYCVMVDEYETEELSVKTSYKKSPLQGNDAIIDPKLNVRNARALPMLCANIVNFFRIK